MNPPNTPLKVKIVLCCLLAPLINANFDILISYAFVKGIGFEPDRISHFGVLGCYKESWMSVAAFFFYVPFFFVKSIVGYKLSQREEELLKLLGALLLYGIVFHLGEKILFLVVTGYHSFLFIENKMLFQERAMPLFGNMYTYMWVKNIVDACLHLFYLYLCYLVVFRYWDKQMRVYFFTYGAAACALGLYLWYFVLGPFLY